MPALYTNQATSTLAASITSSATSMTVQTNHGARFPAADSVVGSYFFATLDNGSGTVEIVKVTDRLFDTFTMERAQDGTSAAAFSAGATMEIRVTRALLDAIKLDSTPEIKNQQQTTLTNSANWTFTGIPSWATEIDIHCDNFTRSSQNAAPFLRIGNGSINTSSPYKGTQMYSVGSSGGPIYGQLLYYENKWYLFYGAMTSTNGRLLVNLRLIDKNLNTWAIQGGFHPLLNGGHWMTGYKSLSGKLDRFELTIGAGTFSGTFNVSYR
jgi:hypothetical protein